MRSEVFSGAHLRHVFENARAALGEDAVILRTEVLHHEGATRFQLTVAPMDEVETLRRRLNTPAPVFRRGPYGRGDIGPFVMALVGPTGSGKTTTVAKLALNASAFRNQRVGVLTVDTYRVGALEQIGELAALADLVLEVAYEPKDMLRALARLDECDVVIIDTPGRSPHAQQVNGVWRSMLQSVSPDEVHLMIPSGLRPDLAAALVTEYAACRPTHALYAKVDELHDESALVDLSDAVPLPARWVTTGQDIPHDLDLAHGRVLAALGTAHPDTRMVAA